MPDIFTLMTRWWKQMLLIVITSVVIVGTIVFLQPSEYLSVATAVPANPALTDKSRVFNENIEALYPPLGGADELDIVVGTGQLDTVYMDIAEAFQLANHYHIKKQATTAIFKAAAELKKNSSVGKSEYGELKVKVWDTDKNMAAGLSNAIMDKLNSIHQTIQNENNEATLKSLEEQRNILLRQLDSNHAMQASTVANRQSTIDQLARYEKLVNEYSMITHTKPAVLIVVDRARPASWPDRPKRLPILVVTAFLAILFGLAVALVMERRKKASF